MTSREVEEIKAHIDSSIAELKGSVAELKGSVAELQGSVAEVKGTVAEVQGTVAEVQGTVAEVQGTGAEVKGQVERLGGELREEIAQVRREAGAHAEDLRSEIRLVADGVALANERIDRVDLRVDDLTGEMRRGFAGVRADIRRLHETDDALRQRIEGLERRGA